MRRTARASAALAAVSLTAAALVGCAQTGTTDCVRPAATSPALADLVSVSGPSGSDVQVPVPFSASKAGFADLETGEGTPLVSPAQVVSLDMTIVDGDTGTTVFTTADSPSGPGAFPFASWIEALPPLDEALTCAKAGSRVVVALAPDDITPQTAAALGITAGGSAVAVVDLQRVYLPHAQGALQFNVGNGLPSVVRAPDGRPGVTIPNAAPPEEIVTQTLIKGDGPVVAADDTVRVQFTGLTWAERTVFQTTWDTEPAAVPLGSVIPAFADAVAGHTVGSQVMVVIPPDEGYGDAPQQDIPAGSTLVFVIDILGVDEGVSQ